MKKEINFREFRNKPINRPDGKSALKDRRFSDNRNIPQENIDKINKGSKA